MDGSRVREIGAANARMKSESMWRVASESGGSIFFNHNKSSSPKHLLNPKPFSQCFPSTPKTSPHSPLRLSSSSSSSSSSSPAAVPSPATNPPLDAALPSASDVVNLFYDGINRRDLASVEGLIADTCVYEDLIFSTPFVGREDILGFFRKFADSITADLQFVIDDISTQDSSAVGVVWHLEWKGKEFPFSKGCSFYRLVVAADGNRQIIYARDSVEPAFKPGHIALTAISGVTWLLEKFPQLADRI